MRRRITTVFFLVTTVAALLGWLFGVKSDTSENRRMAEVPRVSASALVDKQFYSQLNDFINDHLPFRGYLIRSKNWIDYRLFRTSPSNRVVIGRDGWLYYAESMEDYLKDSCGARDQMRELARRLNRFERAVESMGKRFVFVVAPNKSTIYPEHVGIDRPPHGCGKSRYDLLLEAFSEFPVRGFVRLDDRLIEAKKSSMVYSRTDTHWSDTGAMIASEAILRQISPMGWEGYFPEVEFMSYQNNNDLAGMIEMFFVDWRETTMDFKNINYVSVLSVTQRDPLKDNMPRPSYTATPLPGKALLPRVLIYRDSFMRTPVKVLKGSFDRLDTLWTASIPVSREVDYDDFMASGIIIIEIVERHLQHLDILVEGGSG